jgi:hypothetical protein
MGDANSGVIRGSRLLDTDRELLTDKAAPLQALGHHPALGIPPGDTVCGVFQTQRGERAVGPPTPVFRGRGRRRRGRLSTC